jgi:hypothetical protein
VAVRSSFKWSVRWHESKEAFYGDNVSAATPSPRVITSDFVKSQRATSIGCGVRLDEGTTAMVIPSRNISFR